MADFKRIMKEAAIQSAMIEMDRIAKFVAVADRQHDFDELTFICRQCGMTQVDAWRTQEPCPSVAEFVDQPAFAEAKETT